MKSKLIEQNLLPILVIYKELITDSLTYNTLSLSLNSVNVKLDLYIYDNSPADFFQVNNSDIISPFNIIYIRDVTNPGVSKAYNQGALYAKQSNKKYILLLDQDTKFPIHTINAYFEALNKYPNHKIFAPTLISKFGIISPGKSLLCRSSVETKILNSGINGLKNKSLLNSGLVIDLALFQSVNGFNEKIPLDFSDTYFIKIIQNKIKEFVLIDLKCQHSLSTENVKYENVLHRFKYYCLGVIEYSKISNSFWVYTWAFFRTFKLAIKFRKLDFICIYFKTVVHNS